MSKKVEQKQKKEKKEKDKKTVEIKSKKVYFFPKYQIEASSEEEAKKKNKMIIK